MQINILLQSATIWLRRWKKWSECLEEHQASVVNEILISRRLKNLCFSIAFFCKKKIILLWWTKYRTSKVSVLHAKQFWQKMHITWKKRILHQLKVDPFLFLPRFVDVIITSCKKTDLQNNCLLFTTKGWTLYLKNNNCSKLIE